MQGAALAVREVAREPWTADGSREPSEADALDELGDEIVRRVATADTEADLLALAEGCTTEVLERRVRAWRRGTAADEAERADQLRRARRLAVYPDEDGGGRSELEDGTRVSAETGRRLTCDAATVHVSRGAGGEVLDVGRRTRTVRPALRRALEGIPP